MEKEIVMTLDRALKIKKAIEFKKKMEVTSGLKGPRVEEPLINFCAGLTENFCTTFKLSYITREHILKKILPDIKAKWFKDTRGRQDFDNQWFKKMQNIEKLLKYHKEMGCPL